MNPGGIQWSAVASMTRDMGWPVAAPGAAAIAIAATRANREKMATWAERYERVKTKTATSANRAPVT